MPKTPGVLDYHGHPVSYQRRVPHGNPVSSLRLCAIALVALGACSPTAPTQAQANLPVVTPSTLIKLFDGKSMANFDTWLVNQHETDPNGVFSVVSVDGAPAIRVSGQTFGGFITKQAYRNYKLTVEFRWGGATFPPRVSNARDSGILLHGQGRLGNTGKDFNGPWVRSIEFQIIEGGVGDIIPVAGFGDDGAQIRPSMTVRTRKDRDNENVIDPHGAPNTYTGGRINWWGRSEDWADKIGFRGAQDLETPDLGWNLLEAIVIGGDGTYYVNGKLVNAFTNASFTDGKIMFQSEGAELFFRRIDLQPAR
jgi:hypothetical protein